LSLKIGQVKSDLLRSSSFIANLKALLNLSMLANFQTNRMLLAIFIGLERSMMDFLGKNHHHQGFRLVYELSYPDMKKFWTICIERGDPYKKPPKFFLNQVWLFTHQSKALVELIWNILFSKLLTLISGLKKPKNIVKIRMFYMTF
jgi:hypothetical protein